MTNANSYGVTHEDVVAFVESLRYHGTPWAEGCAVLIEKLWAGYSPAGPVDEATAILRAINAERDARLPQPIWHRLLAVLQREVDSSRSATPEKGRK